MPGYQCPDCDLKFGKLNAFIAHAKEVHNRIIDPTDAKQFQFKGSPEEWTKAIAAQNADKIKAEDTEAAAGVKRKLPSSEPSSAETDKRQTISSDADEDGRPQRSHYEDEQSQALPPEPENPLFSAATLASTMDTGCTRVFVGSLPYQVTDEQVHDLFRPFAPDGLRECYVNSAKRFAILRFFGRDQAFKAISLLDKTMYENALLTVRLGPPAGAIFVSGLDDCISSERLGLAFSRFGAVERAIVAKSCRGQSLGYGVVDFVQKFHAVRAVDRCSQDPFMITGVPKPVKVEFWNPVDFDVGFLDKELQGDHRFHDAATTDMLVVKPRFMSEVAELEGEKARDISYKWMKLYEEERQEKAALREKFALAKKDLEDEGRVAFREQVEKRRFEAMEARQADEMRRFQFQQERQDNSRHYNDMPMSSAYGEPSSAAYSAPRPSDGYDRYGGDYDRHGPPMRGPPPRRGYETNPYL